MKIKKISNLLLWGVSGDRSRSFFGWDKSSWFIINSDKYWQQWNNYTQNIVGWHIAQVNVNMFERWTIKHFVTEWRKCWDKLKWTKTDTISLTHSCLNEMRMKTYTKNQKVWEEHKKHKKLSQNSESLFWKIMTKYDNNTMITKDTECCRMSLKITRF